MTTRYIGHALLHSDMAVVLHVVEEYARDLAMKSMGNIALVFPGQGSQVIGMGKDFAETAAGRELFERADDALGMKLSALMWDGDQAELTLTQNAQPALLVCGLVALEYLKSQSQQGVVEMAGFVAGHSLGEYTAVAAAGGMDFESAVKLVRLRGQAMAEGGMEGGMSAILGLEPEVADRVAREAGVVFANDNSVGQAIFSGPLDKLAVAEEAAKAAGAKRALRLNVSGPFHTPVMRGAGQKVEEFLAANPLRDLEVGCVMNHSAKVEREAKVVAEGLVAQVTGRVRWREGMIQLAENGVTQLLELGGGKVLTGLASRCDARLSGVSLENRSGIDAWLEARV